MNVRRQIFAIIAIAAVVLSTTRASAMPIQEPESQPQHAQLKKRQPVTSILRDGRHMECLRGWKALVIGVDTKCS